MKKRGIYKTDSGLTTFAFPDKETEAKWNAYCREINANRKRKLNPTKEEYLIFCERLMAEKRVRDAAEDLLAALEEALKTIEVFHGQNMWDFYNKNAPEMKMINAAIAKAKG